MLLENVLLGRQRKVDLTESRPSLSSRTARTITLKNPFSNSGHKKRKDKKKENILVTVERQI
ncbi:hypothetical protein ACQP3C_30605, partial [Escherichia coli]